MAAELLAGLGAFKHMFDLAKGLKDLNDATVRNGVAIELQEKILAAQMQQAELIERVGELEKEVTALKAWDADKQRYALKRRQNGVLTYEVKEEMRGSEPTHEICANCYQRSTKSLLQQQRVPDRRLWQLFCPACKTELVIIE